MTIAAMATVVATMAKVHMDLPTPVVTARMAEAIIITIARGDIAAIPAKAMAKALIAVEAGGSRHRKELAAPAKPGPYLAVMYYPDGLLEIPVSIFIAASGAVRAHAPAIPISA
jgi:hypothetical protein